MQQETIGEFIATLAFFMPLFIMAVWGVLYGA